MTVSRSCSCGEGCPYRTIRLTRGLVALVSPVDYEWASKHKWCADKKGYARRNVNGKVIRLHTLIMKPPSGSVVDHIDRNKQDNRRCNLRVVSHAVNVRNSKLDRRNTSGIRGVHWCKKAKRWIAQLRHHGRVIHLGSFTSRNAAAERRLVAEARYWGDEK